jgi:dGTPase
MEANKFRNESVVSGNSKWQFSISRVDKLYEREDEVRSQFSRDYNRILHSKAYRRLKHKTQVFYATSNDHVCTRIEHVNHVASVSYTIAKFLGLNTELTGAISIGHDLGHSPFGHFGEQILREISKKEIGEAFWHEKNSLHFVDDLETLPNPDGKEKNLSLTYAVRDGIISHCGEVNENAIFPRLEPIDLAEIEKPNQFAPYTWEACVVKISDKISYLGRDIEDALTLKILSREQIAELISIVEKIKKVKVSQINNTVLMHDFVNNLCQMSSPENGILFSDKYLELINSVKAFNYKNIYKHSRLKHYGKYAELVISSIYEVLISIFDVSDVLKKNLNEVEVIYPSLIGSFYYWLNKYSDINTEGREDTKFANKIIYNIANERDYKTSVIDYISSMTDNFALKIFSELTRFE